MANNRGGTVQGAARTLADWATRFSPTLADLALAERALQDTVAVALAARREPLTAIAASVLGEAGSWAVAAHLLDYDDLHVPSTTHISTVCVPVTLALNGDARAYLAGAGVMARLGTVLGWQHYQAGWHATTTSGAIGAAATAAVALDLDLERTTIALALAVPASGGVQRAFGTDAKSLQVGFAADAGVRAARLAAAGAHADPTALDDWLTLMGVEPFPAMGTEQTEESEAIPGGLATKIYPCCYGLQRPIAAIVAARTSGAGTTAGTVRSGAVTSVDVNPAQIEAIHVRTPASSVVPLVHHRPRTGLEGKFSLEYAVAAALLDEHPGLSAFTDDAVGRPRAQQLLRLVQIETTPGGTDLLSGRCEVDIQLSGERVLDAQLNMPPGAAARPVIASELARKVADCLTGTGIRHQEITWEISLKLLRAFLG